MDPVVRCVSCEEELSDEIYHSTISRPLILCRSCKILFREMDPSPHIFAANLSKEAFLKLDRSDLDEYLPQPLLSEKLLKKIIQEENDWRLSKETQEHMGMIEHTSYGDWIDYVTQHQHDLMEKYGFTGEMNLMATNILRRASYIFPEDPFYREVPIYVKYNRAGHCLLQNGETVPEMTLHRCNGEEYSMSRLLDTPQPVLLIAGSYT